LISIALLASLGSGYVISTNCTGCFLDATASNKYCAPFEDSQMGWCCN
jgi:hypothetical protein